MPNGSQLLRFGLGAVGNGEAGGAAFEQGQNHAARCAACADKEDALAGQGYLRVAADIGHQAEAVGVVGMDSAIGLFD